MTNKGILYLILGTASVVGGIVALTAISNAESQAADDLKENLKKNSNAYSDALQAQKTVRESLKTLDDYVVEEKTVIEEKIADWKEDSGYLADLRAIQSEVANKYQDFKDTIGYSDEMKKFGEEYEKACEEVKERINYDSRIAAQKKLITDANKAYDTAVFFMEDNQASKAAKKAARKAKDKTIDTANEALEEIEKDLKKELKAPKKEYEEKQNALKKRLADKKTELDKELSDRTDSLNKKLNDARNQIIFDTREKRPAQFKSLLEDEKTLVSRDRDLERKLKGMYEDAYNSLTKTDMFISYLKSNNIKAPVVGIVGIMTGAPLFILTYEYTAKLYYILKSI